MYVSFFFVCILILKVHLKSCDENKFIFRKKIMKEVKITGEAAGDRCHEDNLGGY